MGRTFTDVRDAWRSLQSRKSSSAVMGMVGAAGVGLVAAVFAVGDAYILRPLPYPRGADLVLIEVNLQALRPDTAIPSFDDWRSRGDLFDGLAAMRGQTHLRLTVGDRAADISTMEVSENFFTVLAESSAAARLWSADATNDGRLVLTRRGLRRLGTPNLQSGDQLLGEKGVGLEVSGVLPEAFVFPHDLYAGKVDAIAGFDPGPVATVHRWSGTRPTATGYTLLARLRHGVTVVTVREALSQPLGGGGRVPVLVQSLSSRLKAKVQPYAVGALSAGLLLLLVCAGNLANLFLSRTWSRQHEVAVRRALGASWLSIGRMWFAEVTLISTAILLSGVAIAAVLVSLLAGGLPIEYVTLGSPTLTTRVWAVAACASAVPGALMLLTVLVMHWFRSPELGHLSQDARPTRLLRNCFVAAQSFLALILGVGAVLLLRSYWNLVAQDTGVAKDTIAVLASYPSAPHPARRAEEVEHSLERLRRLPGVTDVGYMLGTIVDGEVVSGSQAAFRIGDNRLDVDRIVASPSFTSVAGMTILSGRPLTIDDRGYRAVLISESIRKRYWSSGSPVGAVVVVAGRQTEIVGVVPDWHRRALDVPPRPAVFVTGTGESMGLVTYVLSSSTSLKALREPVLQTLTSVNAGVAVVYAETVGDLLSESVRDRTFATIVLLMFSAAAVIITAMGLAGIVSFVVARRTREIAIRIALGAPAHCILRGVVADVALATVIGGGCGVVAGQWLSQTLASLAFGVTAGGLSTSLITIGFIAPVVAAKAYLEARKALRIRPSEALRV